MPAPAPIIAQVAAEYGTLIARDVFATIGNLISTSGTEILLIAAAVLGGLYLLTRLM
jgi:hypothetical protein